MFHSLPLKAVSGRGIESLLGQTFDALPLDGGGSKSASWKVRWKSIANLGNAQRPIGETVRHSGDFESQPTSG